MAPGLRARLRSGGPLLTMNGFPPWPRYPSMPAPAPSKLALFLGCLVTTAMSAGSLAAAPDYEKDVLPILRQHCYSCHDGRKQTATLRLDLTDARVQRGRIGGRGDRRGQAGGELPHSAGGQH